MDMYKSQYFQKHKCMTFWLSQSYLYIVHDMNGKNESEDRIKDIGINLSDFLPKLRSLSHVLRLSPYIKETWGKVIRSELVWLFNVDLFSLIDKPLPTDEIIPIKLALIQNKIAMEALIS